MAGSTMPTCGRLRNVIIVEDSAGSTGGTTEIAYLTARILRDRGYNVVYFAGFGPVADRLTGIRTVTVRDRPFLEDSSKIRGALEGLHSKSSYDELCSLLREFKPEDTVVHVHSWTHVLSSSIFDAIADCGFKCVVTLHEYFLVCPNGGFYNYQTNEICHLQPCSFACVRCNCDKRSYAEKLYRVIRLLRQNKSIARANPTFCYLSPFTYDIMKGNRFDNGNPIFLPNPIAVSYSGDPTPIEDRHGYLYIGRFDTEKNPRLFCEAITRLGLSGSMCGSGPELENLKREFPNINFLGWCDKRSITDQLLTRKALVMTSSWYEASPLVCLEAMFTAHIPSIIPETCGATAYVENDVNGIYFKNNDIDSLCDALRKIEDSATYRRICANVDDKLPALRKDRSYEAYGNRVINIYGYLLSGEAHK